MGYDHKFTVPLLGLSGGLALFWRPDIELNILSYSPNYIDTVVTVQQHLYMAIQQDNDWRRFGTTSQLSERLETFFGSYPDILMKY